MSLFSFLWGPGVGIGAGEALVNPACDKARAAHNVRRGIMVGARRQIIIFSYQRPGSYSHASSPCYPEGTHATASSGGSEAVKGHCLRPDILYGGNKARNSNSPLNLFHFSAPPFFAVSYHSVSVSPLLNKPLSYACPFYTRTDTPYRSNFALSPSLY